MSFDQRFQTETTKPTWCLSQAILKSLIFSSVVTSLLSIALTQADDSNEHGLTVSVRPSLNNLVMLAS